MILAMVNHSRPGHAKSAFLHTSAFLHSKTLSSPLSSGHKHKCANASAGSPIRLVWVSLVSVARRQSDPPQATHRPSQSHEGRSGAIPWRVPDVGCPVTSHPRPPTFETLKHIETPNGAQKSRLTKAMRHAFHHWFHRNSPCWMVAMTCHDCNPPNSPGIMTMTSVVSTHMKRSTRATDRSKGLTRGRPGWAPKHQQIPGSASVRPFKEFGSPGCVV